MAHTVLSHADNRERVRKLVITGMLTALLFILGFTPLGFVPVGIADITTMNLPVVIGLLTEGLAVGTTLGGMFGAISIFQAYTRPTSIFAIYMQDPLCSVLPRVLMPVVTFGVVKLLERTKMRKQLIWAVAGALSALINTLGVLGMVYIRNAGRLAEVTQIAEGMKLTNEITTPDVLLKLLLGIAGLNGSLEAVFGAVVVPAIMSVLIIVLKRSRA